MDITKIRRMIALALLLVIIVGANWSALSVRRTGYFTINDWIHAFCLSQTILLAAWTVYGPGRFAMRLPFVAAWGLSIGFALARANLISMQGRASLAAGAILVIAGTLPSLTIFAMHRWRAGATISRCTAPVCGATPHSRQLSLQMLMVMMTAFAVTAVLARAAITARPDPLGNEHDKLALHAWLAFFPCMAATPAFFVVFRPSWRIVLAGCFFFIVAFVQPIAFGFIVPLIFEDKSLAAGLTEGLSWDDTQRAFVESVSWLGQTLVATVIYALLARVAGFQMTFAGQSNDKKPKPSGEPAAEAGCVQD